MVCVIVVRHPVLIGVTMPRFLCIACLAWSASTHLAAATSLADQLTMTFDSQFPKFSAGPTGLVTWRTTLPHGLRTLSGNSELQYYSDASTGVDPFGFDGDILAITAAPGANSANLPYDSGIITTLASFSQLYGYFEMVAQLPTGAGMWPAFWMLPKALNNTVELDVMEQYGTMPGQYSVTLHSPAAGIVGAQIAAQGMTTGPHAYGVYWTPTTLSYYLDGVQVAVAPTPPDFNTPMFMLANLAIANDVLPSTVFPASLLITSIRAYAYNPAIPGPAAPLLVNVPGPQALMEDSSSVIPSVGTQDTDMTGATNMQVTVSTKSLGIMSVTPAGAVQATGQNSWAVQLTGTAADLQATLASLTYKNVPFSGGAAPAADTITVAAADADGNMDTARIAVTLAPGPVMTDQPVGPAPERIVAKENEVFDLRAGAIANPTLHNGQAESIIDFRTAGTFGTSADFLALHGFDSTARLVFDHYAAPGGVVNYSQQFYRVQTTTTSSPIFLLEMESGGVGHLGAADYAFYPQ